MKNLRTDVNKYAWVVSFNTVAQLETMAYLCYRLDQQERQPWITVDEVRIYTRAFSMPLCHKQLCAEVSHAQGDAILRTMEQTHKSEQQLAAILSGGMYETTLVSQGTKFNTAEERSGRVRRVHLLTFPRRRCAICPVPPFLPAFCSCSMSGWHSPSPSCSQRLLHCLRSFTFAARTLVSGGSSQTGCGQNITTSTSMFR